VPHWKLSFSLQRFSSTPPRCVSSAEASVSLLPSSVFFVPCLSSGTIIVLGVRWGESVLVVLAVTWSSVFLSTLHSRRHAPSRVPLRVSLCLTLDSVCKDPLLGFQRLPLYRPAQCHPVPASPEGSAFGRGLCHLPRRLPLPSFLTTSAAYSSSGLAALPSSCRSWGSSPSAWSVCVADM